MAFTNPEINPMLFVLSRLWPLYSPPPSTLSVSCKLLDKYSVSCSPPLACNTFKDSKETEKLKRQQSAGGEAMNENKFLNTDSSTGSVETTVKPLPFKDPNFIHSGIGGAAAGKKNRTWKNLKQILASERALPWQLNDPSYFNIDAPPSFKPAKKYSDISGLPANYTDPQSKLRFSTIEEFAYIRMLPSDVVTGYLALRKATSIVS
ncbi:INO80 complex subunit C [Antrostomus carolinensis]|uniref:INO80 complex subunit C n=1 Tax=Antrostomus carolinensis TaxID=279965 RepID=UPI0010A98731|nr:INO80 complex subunit C [Antrostomus carolinensis]